MPTTPRQFAIFHSSLLVCVLTGQGAEQAAVEIKNNNINISIPSASFSPTQVEIKNEEIFNLLFCAFFLPPEPVFARSL